MAKTCEFGKRVKIRLVELDKTQAWLVKEVRARTGMYFDDGYLWKILSGERTTIGIVQAIKEALELS